MLSTFYEALYLISTWNLIMIYLKSKEEGQSNHAAQMEWKMKVDMSNWLSLYLDSLLYSPSTSLCKTIYTTISNKEMDSFSSYFKLYKEFPILI